MDLEWDVIARLVAAAALGAVVGIEREVANQPAGLRTHMTVALGAALFGAISTTGFEEFAGRDRAFQADVTRVASTVVTGIGFLGAGMIFRRGSAIHNLTTAASLWVVAAIGLSCGVGDPIPAVAATGALLLGLVALRYPRRWIHVHLARPEEPVRIVLADGAEDGPVAAALAALPGVEVQRMGVEKDRGAYALTFLAQARRGFDLREQLSDVARRADVVSLRVGVIE